ncbi:MAG: GntR family transcriptional regulator [Deltaproteobacteria bacterium]|nr:GntR family transcriptional regulator [Deltaproteobacteria bacterium]MBW2049020.1 GntR family transcriptional regulator [Deltaproteobacteria bacterium]MBW2147832.1 GntR family transcriptional regulator [Deltaproteobacteria bacterium]
MAKNGSVPLKQRIHGQTRHEIIFGKVAPGERITENRLTEKFQCSRGPVREALIQLEREGFVILVPNQGAVVTKISPKEVEDFYTLLELLEGKAVEWAAPHLVAADIKKLTEINNKLKQISQDQKNQVEKWVPLNQAFHRFFRERCSNGKMNWIIEEIRLRITRHRYTSLAVTALDDYVKDHEAIVDAIRQGDPGKAREAMKTHIHRARLVLMDFLSRFPGF